MSIRIAVIGDVIIDRYIYARVSARRTSTGGEILVVDRIEDRLGGAGAVAMIASSLGASVSLIGICGDECNAILKCCNQHSIVSRVMRVPNRVTTVKYRFVVSGLLRDCRVDYESTTTISPRSANRLYEAVDQSCPDIILLADHAKGVCTPELWAILRTLRVPILVDPSDMVRPNRYSGARLIKCNRQEAESFGQFDRPVGLDFYCEVLANRSGTTVVITDAENPAYVCDPVSGSIKFPVHTCNAVDTTGAGDTVLSTLGVCLGKGMSLVEAIPIAMRNAARQCEHLGVIPITQEVLA